MDIKIFSCFHKPFKIPNSDVIYPIHVGKANSSIHMDMITDYDGDNISVKNNNYCELTAVYWAWKNIKCDIIGLTHYRRYFELSSSRYEVKIEDDSILDSKVFEKYKCKIENTFLSGYDIIMAKPIVFDTSVRNQYINSHIREDIEILESVIKKKYPNYMKSYDYIMNKQNKISAYNMFIMNKIEFDKYCEWLFSILFEVENKVNISEYPYQARIFGFMSERLLNVYVYHNKLKVKYNSIIFIDNKLKSKKNYRIKQKLRNIRNNIKFRV